MNKNQRYLQGCKSPICLCQKFARIHFLNLEKPRIGQLAFIHGYYRSRCSVTRGTYPAPLYFAYRHHSYSLAFPRRWQCMESIVRCIPHPRGRPCGRVPAMAFELLLPAGGSFQRQLAACQRAASKYSLLLLASIAPASWAR